MCMKFNTHLVMPLQFQLYPVPNKQNENAIRVSINVKGARLITTIGYSVKPDARLEGAQVKQRYTNSKGVPARVINDRISKIKLHFNEYELQQKTRPTLKELREELDIAFALGNDLVQDEIVETPKEKKKTIYQYLDEFVKNKVSSINGPMQLYNVGLHSETTCKLLEKEQSLRISMKVV